MPFGSATGTIRDTSDIDTAAHVVDAFFYNGSGADIAAKDWVQHPTSSPTGQSMYWSIEQGTATQRTCGVALAAIPNGQWGLVRTYGPVAGAKTDTNVAAGNALMSAASGACAPFSGGTRVIGYALEADTSAAGPVIVTCM